MKTLILAHSFPKNDEDYRGRFILDYIESYPKREFHVIAPYYEKSFIKKWQGATIHYFKWRHGYLAGRKLYNPFTIYITLKMIYIFYFNSRKIIKEFGISNIFSCWALPGGFAAWLLNKFIKISYSVWLLGTDVNKFINIPFFLPVVLRSAHKIYSNSEELRKRVQKKYKDLEIETLPTKSSLPNPIVPENQVDINKDNLNVFFVGRLEKIKGIDTYLEIAEKVKEMRHNVTFFVIGDGSLTKIVKSADDKGIIKYLGRLSPGELSYYSKYVDILLITSRKESMPVVFWEFKDKARIFSFPVGDIPNNIKKEYLCHSVDSFIKNILIFNK